MAVPKVALELFSHAASQQPCSHSSRRQAAHTAALQEQPPGAHKPFSMYTTSSVATLPVAPWAYGQPPSPATAGKMAGRA